jgi:hypothetical protein
MAMATHRIFITFAYRNKLYLLEENDERTFVTELESGKMPKEVNATSFYNDVFDRTEAKSKS